MQAARGDGSGCRRGDWLWLDISSWHLSCYCYRGYVAGHDHSRCIPLEDTAGNKDPHLPLLLNISLPGELSYLRLPGY